MISASSDGPARRLASESAVMTVVPGAMPLSAAGGVAVGADITIAGVAVASGTGVDVALGGSPKQPPEASPATRW